MRRFSLALIVALGLFTGSASAVIFMLLHDEFDDREVVLAAKDDQQVQAFGRQMDDLKDRLLRLKQRHIEALFGAPSAMPPKTFAMPVAQPRGLALSGIRYADPTKNKDHTEFYTLGDSAGMEVYYSIDGISPSAILFYQRVDGDFPKLTKDNLVQRLTWEQGRIRKLPRLFNQRWTAVYVWEVDGESEKTYFQDDFSSKPDDKLKSWKASCEKLGYRLVVGPGDEKEGPVYSWYRKDDSLARRARPYTGCQLPNEFIWFHPDGHTEYRRECFHAGHAESWRWCRPGTTDNIRFDGAGSDGRPNSWTWYGAEGKVIHQEWDDNGDGVPDFVADSDRDKGQPIDLINSWAVHPELIPEECRIPDQPERRVPIRKIPVPSEGD